MPVNAVLRVLVFVAIASGWLASSELVAQRVQPGMAYIFPPGAQRGTDVKVTIGGYNLTPSTQLHFLQRQIRLPSSLAPTGTSPPPVPHVKSELANRAFDYPREMQTVLRVPADCPPGPTTWYASTAQGGTSANLFVVGDLPEFVEPQSEPRRGVDRYRLAVPSTANGRIGKAEEVDRYVFAADNGTNIRCEIVSERIGSTLDAVLAVIDETGKVVARDEDAKGLDAALEFTVERSGDYTLLVHDYAYSGSPSHVYRVTVLNTKDGGNSHRAPPADSDLRVPALSKLGARFEFAAPIAVVKEIEPNHVNPQSLSFQSSAAVHGTLNVGDVDRFLITGRKGARVGIQVRAARLGSRLDSLLTVSNSAGKELTRSDDSADSADSELEFTFPADGDYVLNVSDLSGAGGTNAPEAIYELMVGTVQPGFTLRFAADHVDVPRDGKVDVLLKVERDGGFDGEIDLKLTGEGVGLSVESPKIPAKKGDHKLTLKTTSETPIGGQVLGVEGIAEIAGRVVQRQAISIRARSDSLEIEPQNSILVTVTHPSRFRITADDTYFFRSRGTTHPATIRIERDPGFETPITLFLADNQIRYLSGITGPTQIVPSDAKEVVYPLTIPDSVELNRTCRVLVMGMAEVEGNQHVLSVSPKQCVMRMEPAVLALRAVPDYVEVKAGRDYEFQLVVQRALGFKSAIRIEMLPSEEITGVAVSPIELHAEDESGRIVVRVTDQTQFSTNKGHLRFRATGEFGGLPVVADALIECHSMTAQAADPLANTIPQK